MTKGAILALNEYNENKTRMLNTKINMEETIKI